MQSKLSLLKIRNTISISDCLSRQEIKLRKAAKELKSKNFIYAHWVFRGEVFYSLTESGERLRAASEAFDELVKRGQAVAPRPASE